MHYWALLVHSLWEHLWIHKYFNGQKGSDLRKHNFFLVDTKFFRKILIHSLWAEAGDTWRSESHKQRKIFAFCDAILSCLLN